MTADVTDRPKLTRRQHAMFSYARIVANKSVPLLPMTPSSKLEIIKLVKVFKPRKTNAHYRTSFNLLPGIQQQLRHLLYTIPQYMKSLVLVLQIQHSNNTVACCYTMQSWWQTTNCCLNNLLISMVAKDVVP